MADGTARRPRRLTEPVADEVSLVDRPANRREFAVLKRADMDEETAVEDVDVGKGSDDGASALADLYAEAREVLEKIAEVHAERVAAARPKRASARRRPEDVAKGVHLAEILKGDEELDALCDLFEVVEKVMGQYPYPSPFRRYPYPSPGAYPTPVGAPYPYPQPTAFDAGRLRTAVNAALGIPGVPDAVKDALKEVLAALEAEGEEKNATAGVAKSDEANPEYVTKAALDVFVADLVTKIAETLFPAPAGTAAAQTAEPPAAQA